MTTVDSNGKPNAAASPRPPQRPAGLFHRMAGWTTRATGGRWGFLTALCVVLVWAISGPFYHYSELWQMVINTATTIVTFLMVFLIQNAQNRESKAVHLKLDELIRAVKTANNEMINIETLTEEQLEHLAARYRLVAARHRKWMETLENAPGPLDANTGGERPASVPPS
jgi:low affinity Fe/Cu permease